MSLQYDLSELADRIAAVIETAEGQLRLDQAVYGLDARDELTLQGMIAKGLAGDYGVFREVHYPSTRGAKLTHRPRCDLVLTPRGRELWLDRSPPTLFDPVDFCEASEALWLEVKVAYQFREGGVRHGGYGQQWQSAVIADLQKMEADPQIKDAALVLIVFNEGREIIEKDLDLFESVLTLKGVVAGFRQVRMIEITERIGHRLCTIAIWPTVQRG